MSFIAYQKTFYTHHTVMGGKLVQDSRYLTTGQDCKQLLFPSFGQVSIKIVQLLSHSATWFYIIVPNYFLSYLICRLPQLLDKAKGCIVPSNTIKKELCCP